LARTALKLQTQTFEEAEQPETTPVDAIADVRVEWGSEQAAPATVKADRRNNGFLIAAAVVIVPPGVTFWSGHPIAAGVLLGVMTTLVLLISAAGTALDDVPPYMRL
jgi:hypothetical protein